MLTPSNDLTVGVPAAAASGLNAAILEQDTPHQSCGAVGELVTDTRAFKYICLLLFELVLEEETQVE